jgi:hypothetical protein
MRPTSPEDGPIKAQDAGRLVHPARLYVYPPMTLVRYHFGWPWKSSCSVLLRSAPIRHRLEYINRMTSEFFRLVILPTLGWPSFPRNGSNGGRHARRCGDHA